jgi:hypothetical protein
MKICLEFLWKKNQQLLTYSDIIILGGKVSTYVLFCFQSANIVRLCSKSKQQGLSGLAERI